MLKSFKIHKIRILNLCRTQTPPLGAGPPLHFFRASSAAAGLKLQRFCLSVCLQIVIGNAHYSNCSCIRYVKSEDSEDLWLAIGLAVGLGVLLILIIVAVIVGFACRRRRKNTRTLAFYNDGTGSTEYQQADRQYYAMPVPAADTENSANEFCCSPNKPDDFPFFPSVEKK